MASRKQLQQLTSIFIHTHKPPIHHRKSPTIPSSFCHPSHPSLSLPYLPSLPITTHKDTTKTGLHKNSGRSNQNIINKNKKNSSKTQFFPSPLLQQLSPDIPHHQNPANHSFIHPTHPADDEPLVYAFPIPSHRPIHPTTHNQHKYARIKQKDAGGYDDDILQ